MAKVLSLNIVALALLGDNTQVRIRTDKSGALQIRPSARVLSTNLPEGELMRNVSFKREDGKVRGATVNVNDSDAFEVGNIFSIAKGKYGWLTLTPATEAPKGEAYGRVSAK